MFKGASYRIDGLGLVLKPDTSLVNELASLGYPVREPKMTDSLRRARGYNPANAKVISVAGKDYTLQTRPEIERDNNGQIHSLPDSGFIALSGGNFDHFPTKTFLNDIEPYVKCSRADVACDLVYSSTQEMQEVQNHLAELVGFSPSYMDGNVQNPDNALTAGKHNSKSPITVATKTISNGLTLYIGSRSSKFMARIYDKSAEVLKKTEKKIAPTLRYECEVKQEIADGVRRYLTSSPYSASTTYKQLWHGLNNDFLTFNGETVGSVLGLDKAKDIDLDYSKVEGEPMEYDRWVRNMVAPKFRKLYSDLTYDKKIEKLCDLFGIAK